MRRDHLQYGLLFGAATAMVGLTAANAAGPFAGTMNFENQTSGRVVQIPGWEDSGNNVKEVEYGDYDSDGDLDAAMALAGGIFGLRRNKLYRNDGGVFTEISNTSVIPGFATLDLTRHRSHGRTGAG